MKSLDENGIERYKCTSFVLFNQGKDEDGRSTINEKENYGLEYVAKKEKGKSETINLQTSKDEETLPALIIDYEKYAELLEEEDVSEDQEREFIETIWNVVVTFVDLGIGVHSAHHACGKPEKNSRKPALTALDGVECSQENLFNEVSGTANIENDDAVEEVNL